MRAFLCRLLGHKLQPLRATISAEDANAGYQRITVWCRCSACDRELADLVPYKWTAV